MPRIGRFPPFGKRFFRLARKLIGNCHFQHFWRIVAVLAAMQGRRSLGGITKLVQRDRTRQAIAFFLTQAHWDAPELLRRMARDRLSELGYRPGDTMYLVIDDTQKRKRGKKMDAVSTIFLHAEKVYAQGHTILGAALVYRGVVIPVAVRLWANEEFCALSQQADDPAEQVAFLKLTELAAKVIASSPLPADARGIVLFDSYYLCPTVTEACTKAGYRYVGAAKKNRNFRPDGRLRDKRKLARYGKNVLDRDGRWRRAAGKKHRLAQRVGHLSKLGRVKLVFSRRPKETSWIALATNETRWSARTVLSHYLFRWGIEVFFKMSKQHLGLGDYQMLRYRAIERYLCLVLIAHLLLTHLALRELGAQAKTNDGSPLRLPSIPQLQQDLRSKLWDDFINSLEQGTKHRAAARKIKGRIQL